MIKLQLEVNSRLGVKVFLKLRLCPLAIRSSAIFVLLFAFSTQLTAQTTVSTLAGNGIPTFQDGSATMASFNRPRGLAVDAFNNVYVADESNHRIRKITQSGQVSTVAGTGTAGYLDGPANIALFDTPTDVEVDAFGNLYVVEFENHTVRKISPSGNVSTVAGTGAAGFINGPVATARFRFPVGIGLDGNGNIYVADMYNHVIRKIDVGGMVSTVAGNGQHGYVDSSASNAQFNQPNDVVVAPNGELFVADRFTHRIRKISLGQNPMVTTLAGIFPSGCQNGPPNQARFNNPVSLDIDGNGNLYIADHVNNKIRIVDPLGNVSTLTGNGSAGWVDGPVPIAELFNPSGIAVGQNGAVYSSDLNSHRIRQIILGTAPVPAVSEWGLIILALLILCIGGVVLKYRGQATFNTP